jgi:hypothetical protein
VSCTNCGGDTGPAFWVTVLALIVAAVALFIAFREHRAFMREVGARARFRLIPSVVGSSEPGYTMRTDETNVEVRVVFGLKNDGNKAATATVLNALVGRESVVSLRWCGPNGEDLDSAPQADTTREDFEANGNEVPAWWLPLDVPRVAKRPYYMKYFTFLVAVPTAGEVTVPVRLKAQADELPDDQDEAVKTLTVRVVRAT